MLSYARINNCKKWTLTTGIHYTHTHTDILWKLDKSTIHITYLTLLWRSSSVCVCVLCTAHSPRNRMEFIYFIYTCWECILFGVWWHYSVLLCCIVFVHFATIKRNKIKSNLCHAWCTVHRTLFEHFLSSFVHNHQQRASATVAVFQL